MLDIQNQAELLEVRALNKTPIYLGRGDEASLCQEALRPAMSTTMIDGMLGLSFEVEPAGIRYTAFLAGDEMHLMPGGVMRPVRTPDIRLDTAVSDAGLFRARCALGAARALLTDIVPTDQPPKFGMMMPGRTFSIEGGDSRQSLPLEYEGQKRGVRLGELAFAAVLAANNALAAAKVKEPDLRGLVLPSGAVKIIQWC